VLLLLTACDNQLSQGVAADLFNKSVERNEAMDINERLWVDVRASQAARDLRAQVRAKGLHFPTINNSVVTFLDVEKAAERAIAENNQSILNELNPLYQVRSTSEGASLIEAFEKAFMTTDNQIFVGFPESYMTRAITYEDLREAYEKAVIPLSSRPVRRGGEETMVHRLDWTPLLEVLGVEPAWMWYGTERYINIENEYRAAFGRSVGINPFPEEPSLPMPGEDMHLRAHRRTRMLSITIDQLEYVVRRSIEENVNHVETAIWDGVFPR
jgi:hypothetical protein